MPIIGPEKSRIDKPLLGSHFQQCCRDGRIHEGLGLLANTLQLSVTPPIILERVDR